MSGGGAGEGGSILDLPNKISLEALPVSYFMVRSRLVIRYPGVQWSVMRVLGTHYLATGQGLVKSVKRVAATLPKLI